jgi:TolA-binding protein
LYRDISKGIVSSITTDQGILAIAAEEFRRVYGELSAPAEPAALNADPISSGNAGLEDEIAALKMQVDALHAELATTQTQAREQREELDELLAEREAHESNNTSELENVSPQHGALESGARTHHEQESQSRSGLASRRRGWHRLTDRVLKWVAIGAFVLAACGIVTTVIYSFSVSESSPAGSSSRR